jgi:uncharacterized protein YdhG (YjbR/CyaY superfamily)
LNKTTTCSYQGIISFAHYARVVRDHCEQYRCKTIDVMKVDFKNVEEYLETFPTAIKIILEAVRAVILKNAPNAIEGISYGMPAYKTNKKPLVYFGAFKNHIGFYATPTGHSQFAEALSKYKQGKGSVQFPFDDVPYELIERIVQFRVIENESNSG